MGAHLVLLQHERAVGDAFGGILFPALAGRGHILAAGHVGKPGHQVQEVCGGLLQLHLEGLVVQGLDRHFVPAAFAAEVLISALDVVGHQEGVGGGHLRGAGPLPGVLVVVGGDRLAVGPGQAVPQIEGVHGVLNAVGVGRELVALGGCHLDAVPGVAHQAVVEVQNDMAAHAGGVKLGVPGLGFLAHVVNQVLRGCTAGAGVRSGGLRAVVPAAGVGGGRAGRQPQDHGTGQQHGNEMLRFHNMPPFSSFPLAGVTLWQATAWLLPTSVSGGSCSAHNCVA